MISQWRSTATPFSTDGRDGREWAEPETARKEILPGLSQHEQLPGYWVFTS